MKSKTSQDAILRNHGYFTYACNRGGQFALHACGQVSGESHRGTFKTKREAMAAALQMPKITTEGLRAVSEK